MINYVENQSKAINEIKNEFESNDQDPDFSLIMKNWKVKLEMHLIIKMIIYF